MRVAAGAPKTKVQAGRVAAKATPKRNVREPAKPLVGSLEQQKAISEILRVMSGSPGDVKPVLDVVAERAAHLCEAPFARVSLVDGDLLRAVAAYSIDGTPQASTVPIPLKRSSIAGRAVVDRRLVHHADVLPLLDTEYPDAVNARRLGLRAVLGVPLIRDGGAYGVIFLFRREPRAFSPAQVALVETFARQAAIAIDHARLFKETKEALERQTATAEILRVISESPTDVQPVFDTIATAAMKLCGANRAHVFISDGKLLHIGAFASTSPGPDDEMRQYFPRRLGNDLTASRAILTGGVVVIPDVLNDPEYALKELAPAGGFRSVLAVPLLREGSPIGAIAVSRPEAGPFPDNQIALLQTFAAQAVIAIENVHLFNETKEALEQQTAISEILRVISSSPTDVQPMLSAVAERATKLCEATEASIFLTNGERLHVAARFGTGPRALAIGDSIPLTRGLVTGRALIDRATIHVRDHAEVSEDEYPLGYEIQRRVGYRTLLAVPLMREDRAIGAITLWRMEVRPFTEKQINLVKTFADQAAIAIENVRLFTELEARTVELTRSVGELKALGEVGQAVSSTLDLETVLRTIVSRATQLADVDGGSIYEYDAEREEFYVRATDHLPDKLVEAMRATPIRKGEGVLGRMAITGEPVEIPDIADERAYQSRVREKLIRLGYRSLLAVPLLRESHVLGGLAVNRKRSGAFDVQVIELLKTFATQSALAIQNARLYREIEVKSRELEAASRHKSEFLANMSHELRTPLNAIIGFSEVLSERMFGEINEKQAEYIGDILDSGQHLLSLINDILDLSKIEAGRMELELSDFDLPGTIESTLTLVRERAVRRGVALGRAVDERLGMIRADERKVKQVLLNLLSNALKFTPEGGKIDVRAAMNDGVAEISVTDTGVGIAPEDQATVFEEFRQVGSAAKKMEGTGLGLAISRKFVELHGGRIWVKSQVGKGSTFAFTLPLSIDSRQTT